jgi:hypothetical protein
MNFEMGTIIQAIIGAAAGALGAYIAIRADLADLKARMLNVERATDSAQSRIDKILHRE